MKKIFITGIAGFIGFHLAHYLHKRGDVVAGCDNFNDYYDPELKKDRAALLEMPVVQCEITNQQALEEAIRKFQPTHLVHLAAQAGVRYSQTHPQSYVHSNLDGFVQVLEVCRRRPEMKLIFASSSSVYGLNQKVPFAETDVVDSPANLYGATKRANELMAYSYHHLYGIPATGLRFFTVYGPWGRPDMAYFSFTRNLLEGKPIAVFGEGLLKRDFTYIDDIVAGIAAAMDRGASWDIFNLGNNHPETVNHLIALIETYTGKKALREEMPLPLGDIVETCADISKSQNLLGFQPKISLAEGMKKFLDWYFSYYL